MGSTQPKQYLRIAGMTLLEHSVNTLLACEQVAGVVVALNPADRLASELPLLADSRVRTVAGGRQRSGSVLAALAALLECTDAGDWVLVHDAARPCLQQQELSELIARVIGSDTGGILAEPVVDTVKEAADGGLVARTLDRRRLWRAQTPQMFRLGELHAAYCSAQAGGAALTDEASAMELAGHPVLLVPGSGRNLKVTLPEDLALARWYLGEVGNPCA